jgi:arginine repressor
MQERRKTIVSSLIRVTKAKVSRIIQRVRQAKQTRRYLGLIQEALVDRSVANRVVENTVQQQRTLSRVLALRTLRLA